MEREPLDEKRHINQLQCGHYLYTDWNKQKKLMRQLVNLIIDWIFDNKELLYFWWDNSIEYNPCVL